MKYDCKGSRRSDYFREVCYLRWALNLEKKRSSMNSTDRSQFSDSPDTTLVAPSEGFRVQGLDQVSTLCSRSQTEVYFMSAFSAFPKDDQRLLREEVTRATQKLVVENHRLKVRDLEGTTRTPLADVWWCPLLSQVSPGEAPR